MSVNLIEAIHRRLPARHEILQVFGVVLFAVFGWSIRGFLYKIPSFTLYFDLIANLTILAYMLAFALLESALVMLFLLLLSVIFPARAFQHGFAYKAFIIILVATAASITFESWYKIAFFKDMMAGMSYMVTPFLIGIAVSILLLIALLWVFHAWPRLQKLVSVLMEQLSIFTYIYVPLGLVGLVVVLIRNLA